MGSGNFAASFAAAHGGGVISKRRAQILFSVFVLLGAVLIGKPVAVTLSSRIIPQELFDGKSVLIIIFSAASSMFLANSLHVPQSTSLVTVASVAGVGFYHRQIYVSSILYLFRFWVLLPIAGYFLTLLLGKVIYPPRRGNFWIYEKLSNHQERLATFVIIASCYNAFAVGGNNVANAVGPLVGAGLVDKGLGLLIISPIFGVGSLLFNKSLKATGEEIAPLGIMTAAIISVVTGTLMIIASVCGVPQSFVMIKVASLTAIGSLKNGPKFTFSRPTTRKIYLTWFIAPVIAFAVSFLLMKNIYLLYR